MTVSRGPSEVFFEQLIPSAHGKVRASPTVPQKTVQKNATGICRFSAEKFSMLTRDACLCYKIYKRKNAVKGKGKCTLDILMKTL